MRAKETMSSIAFSGLAFIYRVHPFECPAKTFIFFMVVGGWEELKLTTSLRECLEESEVCQFGGFPPRKKLPDFLPSDLRAFF
jgi:hypothetical protein